MPLTRIQSNAIATGAVTSSALASSAVTTAKIADTNITAGKLSLTSDVSLNGANIDYAGLGETTVTSAANTVLLNFANSAVFTCTLSGATTLTPNNVPSGGCVMLLKLINGGNYTITYAGNPRFSENTAPTLTTSGTDYLYFTCQTNTNYLVTPYTNILQNK